MMKHGIDQDALINQFAQATAQQGEAIRQAVADVTLKALQGRELTLTNIKQVLNTVTSAASAGAANSNLPAPDVEALLTNAIAGMDTALEKAVQANRIALQQMVEHGANVREGQLKKALTDIEKMEDSLFAAVRKAAADADSSLQQAWSGVLSQTQGQGTGTGAMASATLEQFMDTAQQNMREGRALSLRASQAMLDGYATLASGVLIGISEALQQKQSSSGGAGGAGGGGARAGAGGGDGSGSDGGGAEMGGGASGAGAGSGSGRSAGGGSGPGTAVAPAGRKRT